MQYAAGLIAVSTAFAGWAWVAESWAGRALLTCLATSLMLLGVAYAGAGPGVLLKKADGTLGPLAYVLHWPYLAAGHTVLLLSRLLSREAPFHEVAPGLWLGSRPYRWDRRLLEGAGVRSVLDLTAEMRETRFLRRGAAYLCIPVLDQTAPSPDDLAAAVAWLRARVREGVVLLHCQMGHGRSATFAAAYLLATGAAANAAEAVAKLRAVRPGVRLHRKQVDAIDRYAQTLGPARAA